MTASPKSDSQPTAITDATDQPATATTATRIEPSTAPDPQPADTEGDYTRERDNQRAEYWDEQRGEFARLTVKASSKPSVVASVHVALKSIGRYREPELKNNKINQRLLGWRSFDELDDE